MSSSLRVARNAAWLIAQRVVMTLVAILVTAMVARYLGTSDYGLLLLALSYAALFAPLGALGLRPHGVREIAAGRDKAVPIVEDMLILRLYLAVLAALVAFAYLAFVDASLPAALVLAVVAQLVVNTLANCFIDGLYGIESIRAVATVMGASGVTIQAGCVVAIVADAGVTGVAMAYVLGAAVALLLAWHLFRQQAGTVRIRALTRARLAHVHQSWAFFFQSLLYTIRARLDVVIINAQLGAAATGLYGSSQVLVDRLHELHDGLGSALFPRVADLHAAADPALPGLVRSTLKIALVASVPMAVGLVATADGIVRLLFGEAFAAAGPILAILGVGLPFGFVHGILFNVLSAMRLQAAVLWLTVAFTAFGVATMLAGLALAGLPGAAAGFVAGQAAFAIAFAVPYWRRHGPIVSAGDALRIVLANAVLGGALWLLAGYPLAVQVGAGVLLYGATVMGIGLLSVETIRSFLRKRGGA